MILVVEDDEDYAEVVVRNLERNPELPVKVDHLATLAAAEERLGHEPDVDVVLLDLRLPDEEGLRTVRRIAERRSRAAIVVMTALREQELALEAIKLGAHEYLVKDQVTPHLLLRTVRYAYERSQLLKQLADAQRASERERELRKLERLAAQPRASVTAGLYGDASVRDQLQERYEELVGEYVQVLNQALESRAFKVKSSVNEDLRSLANVLGVLMASPRDVVELHTGAMKRVLDPADPDRAQAFVEEGRVTVLELMGYLAAYYRARAVAPMGRSSGGRSQGDGT